MSHYIEVKASIKERFIFLLFSMLKVDLLKTETNYNTFKEENSISMEPKIEEVPFFDGTDSSIKSRFK